MYEVRNSPLVAIIGTIDGTKFLDKPAEMNDGLLSRLTLAPKSLSASLSISSSVCGGGKGSVPSDLISIGISSNRSFMEEMPIISSISCSLPRFGNWSMVTLSYLET